MLAAASSGSDRNLEAVKLVFQLEAKKQRYPDSLKNYIRNVLQQAMDLLENPSSAAPNALPEAVSLAVKLSTDHALDAAVRSIFADLGAEREVSPDQAEVALNSLEAPFDTNRESAHFSREIYRAI